LVPELEQRLGPEWPRVPARNQLKYDRKRCWHGSYRMTEPSKRRKSKLRCNPAASMNPSGRSIMSINPIPTMTINMQTTAVKVRAAFQIKSGR